MGKNIKSENSKQVLNRRKRIIVLLSVICIIATVVALILIRQAALPYAGNTVVAYVNDEPITVDEFRMWMEGFENANTLNYFSSKYDISDQKDFWNRSFNGEVPLEVAKERTLTVLARIKLEQLLAKEKGIVADISYKNFLKSLKRENERRAEAVKNNQVIYGPVKYEEKIYYRYLLDNLRGGLKEKMQDAELKVSDNELLAIYEATKDKHYKEIPEIKVDSLYIDYHTDRSKKESAFKLLTDARTRLVGGEDFKKVADSINSKEFELKYKQFVVNQYTKRNDEKYGGNLMERTLKLKIGEISEVLESAKVLYVVKCLEKNKMEGYRSFEEVKEKVKNEYIDKAYEEYIDKLSGKAKVVKNTSVYEKIEVK